MLRGHYRAAPGFTDRRARESPRRTAHRTAGRPRPGETPPGVGPAVRRGPPPGTVPGVRNGPEKKCLVAPPAPVRYGSHNALYGSQRRPGQGASAGARNPQGSSRPGRHEPSPDDDAAGVARPSRKTDPWPRRNPTQAAGEEARGRTRAQGLRGVPRRAQGADPHRPAPGGRSPSTASSSCSTGRSAATSSPARRPTAGASRSSTALAATSRRPSPGSSGFSPRNL